MTKVIGEILDGQTNDKGGIKMSNGYTSFMNIFAWLVLISGVVASVLIYKEYGTYIDTTNYTSYSLSYEKTNILAIIDIIRVNVATITGFSVIQGVRMLVEKN